MTKKISELAKEKIADLIELEMTKCPQRKGECFINEIFCAIDDLLKSQKEAIIKQIEDLIVKEILICHEENTSTSRLTSLAMKITIL